MKQLSVTPEVMLGDMLDALHAALKEGRIGNTTGGHPHAGYNPLSRHFNTGPWEGLTDVAIRYDCVTFRLEGKEVEARISRLPEAQADMVRKVWMLVDPSFGDVTDIWRTVMGPAAEEG